MRATEAPDRRALQPPELHDAQSMGYSHGIAVSAGVLVHVAGQVADGATGAEQVEAALESVGACCRAAGGSLADVVSMTWFTTEPVAALWESTAPARGRLLPNPPPAMTVVQVAGLAAGKYLVEIAAVAVVPMPERKSQ